MIPKTDSRFWMRYTGNSATGINTQTLFIFVAGSHHCHQALAINNASNDSLANWIVLWTLAYPVLLVKALRLLIQLRKGRWVTDLCPTLTAFSVTQMDVRKSRKHITWQIWIWWWRNCIQNCRVLKQDVFIWFLDQENICLDLKINILHEVISEILEISDFEVAILKKWPKLVVSPIFFW